MSFIQWLGDWLRKVSTSVKSITAGTNTLTYTKHNNDTVTIPLTLESDLYVKKTGDTVTGNINSLYGVDGIETVNQFSGEMAGNDLWAIRTGITGNPDPSGASDSTIIDNGFLEIATADNGTEPIYISQYEGDHVLPDSQGIRFYRRVRRATLLDEHGNTVFPGTVTATSFNGNATSANYATNANYATSAGTASKLGSVDVGSATQPIYLNDGVATACTYQLNKTVPADAVFTDTVYTHPTYTARTGKPATDLTPAFGDTVTVSQVESDGTGHVTGMTDRTITIPTTEASSSAAGLMSATDKSKLDGITAGAEPNQNAFSNIKVGATTVAADGKTDTLELVAGNGMTLTPDATNDKIEIGVTPNTYAQKTHTHDYYPKSGGPLTGSDIYRSVGNSRLFLSGGSAWDTGSQLWLQSKEVGTGITLSAMGTDGVIKSLQLNPNGTMSWAGSLTLSTPLGIAYGGTGQTTAYNAFKALLAGARTNTTNASRNTSNVVNNSLSLNYACAGQVVHATGYFQLSSQLTPYSEKQIATGFPKAIRDTAFMCYLDSSTFYGAYVGVSTNGNMYMCSRAMTVPANTWIACHVVYLRSL